MGVGRPLLFAAKPSVKDIAVFDDGGLLTDRIWLK